MIKAIVNQAIYLILGLIPLVFFLNESFAALPIFNRSVLYILEYIVYISLFATSVMCFKLNQFRAALATLLLIPLYTFSLYPPALAEMNLTSVRYFELITLALPVSLGILFLQKERRLLSLSTLVKIGSILAPFLIIIVWISDFNYSYLKLAYFHFITALNYIEIPQVAIFSIIFFITVAILRRKSKEITFIFALLTSMIPIFIMAHINMEVQFAAEGKFALTIISYLIASSLLIHAIFTMYWQRVYIDELTQIPNRRALDERLSSLTGKFTIGMMDIDHFKKFNDTFGHDAGDDVLRAVGALVKDTQKASVYRYGGEEFTAIFQNMDAEEAFSYADNIRDKIAKKEFYIRQSSERNKNDRGKVENTEKVNVQINISMGLSTCDGGNPEQIIKEADQALYKAKEAGRNTVKIFTK